MKYIYCHDTYEPEDFAVRVSDTVYKGVKQYLIQYHLKHPQEIEFLENWGEEKQ